MTAPGRLTPAQIEAVRARGLDPERLHDPRYREHARASAGDLRALTLPALDALDAMERALDNGATVAIDGEAFVLSARDLASLLSGLAGRAMAGRVRS